MLGYLVAELGSLAGIAPVGDGNRVDLAWATEEVLGLRNGDQGCRIIPCYAAVLGDACDFQLDGTALEIHGESVTDRGVQLLLSLFVDKGLVA